VKIPYSLNVLRSINVIFTNLGYLARVGFSLSTDCLPVLSVYPLFSSSLSRVFYFHSLSLFLIWLTFFSESTVKGLLVFPVRANSIKKYSISF
jgi:hypothetical protein